MNIRKSVSICAAIVAGITSTALGVDTIYGSWTANNITWTDGNGNTTNFVAGSIARITAVKDGEVNPSFSQISPYKVIFDTSTYRKTFWIDQQYNSSNQGQINIGAGGVEFVKRAVFSCGSRQSTYTGVRLATTQTWSGTEPDGYYANAIMGTPAYYNGNYALMPIIFGTSGMTWTINRKLNVWLFSADREEKSGFPNVNVRVEAPARLYLAGPYKQKKNSDNSIIEQPAARMRAKKLTLSGDGAGTFPIGATVELPNQYTGLYTANIGMVTALSPTNVATTLELNNGADLTATTPALFSITNLLVTGTGESVLSGSFTFDMPENVVAVTLADGATLNFAGTFSEAHPGTSLAASGLGKVVIDMPGWRLTGGISAGSGVTLSLAGDGKLGNSVSGACGLEISAGAGKMLYVPESALSGWTGSAITVKSGTLLLDGAIPGVTVTPEEGASVEYGGGLVVTDKVRTETTLNVPAGQALQIYGNGLTSATHVTLGGGTNVHFHTAATIGATMEVAAGSSGAWVTSYFYAPSASVTGTVAGAVSSGSGYSIVATDGPGCVIFGGGGELFSNSKFEVHGDSSAILTGGVYRVGRTGSAGTYRRGTESAGTWGKYLGIRNGGRLEFEQDTATRWALCAYPLRDSSAYKRSATIEVGEGGTVILPDNAWFSLGGDQNSGVLILSGGTMRVGRNCRLLLGRAGYSIGTFRFLSGLLETSSPFYIDDQTNQGLVYWSGGTLKIGASFSSDSLIVGGLGSDNKTRKFSVGILGDCTLDLTDMPTNVLYNIQQTSNRGEWYGNGTLTVKGGKRLRMRSMPNDMNLKIEGTGTKVEVADDTRFFDYTKCKSYCVWRRPWSDGNADNYSSLDRGLEVAGLDVPLLTVTNGLPSLVNFAADRTVTVSAVSVLAGGCWDNATTVDSALADIGSLTFADNAIWHVTLNGAATAARTFTSLAIPSTLGYQVSGKGDPGCTPLLSGTAAIVEPTWSAIQPTKSYTPNATADGTGFWLRGPGIRLIYR